MKKIFSLSFLLVLLSLVCNPLVRADQSVSATIPPRPSDFQFTFAPFNGQSNNQTVNSMTYHITYGAKLSAGLPTTTTIVADWSDDKAPNNADLLSYIDGSATTGYGGAVPIVNLANHMITWTIPALPQGTTDQTLSFQLRTTGNYTGTDTPSYTIRASMNNQYITLPDQTITEEYHYTSLSPTPTATPVPGQTHIITTTTSTPIPTSVPLTFYNISFTGISDSGTTVQVDTTEPSKITVFYGTSPNALTRSATTASYQRRTALPLTNLAADTTYYLQMLVTNLNNQTTKSELFSFKTAITSPQPLLDNDIIILSSNGTIFLSNTQKQSGSNHPAVILTVNSDYEVTYTLTRPMNLRSIEAIVLNKILGTTTLAAIQEPSEIIVPMQENEPALYTANIKPSQAGSYEVYVRLTDNAGNVIQKKITDLKIMPHLTVYAQDTNRPLADARIYLSYYDEKTKRFEPITPQLFGTINNPSYTNALGQSPITLPAGRYRIAESALFYDSATTDFTIGIGSDQNFPVIYLKRNPLNLISFVSFTGNYLSDTWTKIATILHELSSSVRIFHLISVLILGSFVALTFLLFLFRSHIHLRHLPFFVLFHLDRVLNKHHQRYIFGTITDNFKKSLSQALVQIEDADTKTILLQTSTNKAGKFSCSRFDAAVNVLTTKEGFAPLVLTLENGADIPEEGLQIVLERNPEHHFSPASLFLTDIGDILGMLFEVSLVITIILECLFFSIFGLTKTLPYLLLSLVNISIWLFYLKERSEKKEI